MFDRSKGNGSIQKRSPGSWQMRYYGPPDESGQRKQQNETVKGSRREAERLLRERITSVETGTHLARAKETVGQFLTRWLETYAATNTTAKTQQGYRQIVNRYAAPLAHLPVQALTAGHIQKAYSDMLERGLSANTVVHLHRVLHRALALGVKWGVLTRNVADAATAPRIEGKELESWDIETVQQFLASISTSRYPDFYHLALLTGLRRSELAGLQWAALDLADGRLAVVKTLQRISGKGLVEGQPKTARSRRSIALSPDAIALLHEIRGHQIVQQSTLSEAWQNTGYVFTQADGRPVDPDAVTREFARLIKVVKLPHLTVHGLRHAFATLALSVGVDLKTTSEMLGHSTISITADVYSHVLPPLQQAAARAVAEKLRK